MGKDLKGKELGVGIVQRKDGRYMARYTTRFGKRMPPMYAKTEREIKKLYRDAKYQDEHGLLGSGEAVTLNEWFDEWLTLFAKYSLKESTVHTYTCNYNAQIRPYLGGVKLKDLSPLVVQRWMATRLENGLRSVEVHVAILRHCLRDAVVAQLIPNNPVDNIVATHQPAVKTARLTKEQLILLIDYFQQRCHRHITNYPRIIKFLVLTGYRIGEMSGLRFSDIDWEHNVIHVRRTLHPKPHTSHGVYFTTPKTPKSRRDTPMSDALRVLLTEALQQQIQWQAQYPEYWENQDESLQGLVFTTKHGYAVCRAALGTALNTATKTLNQKLPPNKQFPHISPHSFRDTFASIGYEMGVPIKEMQELMGHSEATMTLYYTSVGTEEVVESQNKIHQLLTAQIP